jgi:hypothetical protein
MANINNTQLSKELIDGAKIQVSHDKIPTQLADKVVPVMEVNPKSFRRINVVKQTQNTGTTATIYTTPTDKDFYLVGYNLSLIKDVTATSVLTRLRAVIDGATVDIAQIMGITLTPQERTISNSFSVPIKLDRNTTLTVANSTNVANTNTGCSIIGYTVEP